MKSYFIDYAPLGGVPSRDSETQMVRMFIRSRVEDNQILLTADPTYISRLRGVGSPELVRAWLEGDWNAVTGAYFTEFNFIQHVKKPFSIPSHWIRFRAYDHGFAKPFCCLWFSVSDGTILPYPRGSLIVYREYYGAREPNVGVRLIAPLIAEGILSREDRDEDIAYSVADPSIFKQEDGPPIAERMHKAGVNFRAADNTRIAGWEEVRTRFVGEEDDSLELYDSEGGLYHPQIPMLYIFGTCTNLIRTLPALQHDEKKPEDLDSDGEDHPADTLRYGCMSRPYAREKAKIENMRGAGEMTMDELWEKGRMVSNRRGR